MASSSSVPASSLQVIGAASGLGYGAVKGSFSAGSGKGNSALISAGIMIADVMGAGVLSLPVAVAQFGWLLGSVVMLLMLAMNCHIAMLMWRVFTACPGTRSYVDLVQRAFALAPARHRHFVVVVTYAFQILHFCGLLGLYSLAAGKGLGMVLHDVHICLPVLSCAVCLVVAPILSSSRMLGSWKSLIMANAGTLLLTVGIPLCAMAHATIHQTRQTGSQVVAVAEWNFAGSVRGLSTMCFVFASQFMIVEIMAEMSDPAEFPHAWLSLSAPYQAVVFLVAGVGGYYYVGDHVDGMLADNMPFGPALRAAAICLAVNMVVVFLIKGVILARMLHQAQHGDAVVDDNSTEANRSWAMLAVAIVAAAYLASQVVPFFVVLVDLIGSTLVPVLCYLIPIALYLRWLHDFGGPSDALGAAEKVVIALEILVSLLVFLAGPALVLQRLREEWHTYGFPFDCHCESLWNTCDCSASRPGMTCGLR